MHQHHASGAAGHPAEPEHASADLPLAVDENVLSRLEVDLDGELRFRQSPLVLTDRRLLSRPEGASAWQSWPIQPGLQLRHHDHAGVGTLSLHDANGQLAQWRFTLALHAPVLRLVEQFERRQQALQTGQAEEEDDSTRCPTCKAQMPPDAEECPVCHRENQAPPSTWVLLRLWRFARPYQGKLLAGFLLTLAATAATLVPPYLTMPLMDEVLIPFQNGQAIDTEKVYLLLGGLLASALLAWALGWARTYLLALVSERIGADLRTTTFEHLMRLSLDYFGSKRTGDLMNRVGSETDRINVFLSLHALDFATDVLMIAMTAAILVSINPWLALVTLVPLPFIAWLIHLVRDRLRTGFEKIDRVWGEVTNVLADTIPGIRVVKAFAQEKREADRFRAANQYNLEVNDKLNKTWSLFTPTVSLLTEIGLLVVWAFGIWLVSHHDITVGVLTAFIAYIGRFYGRLDSMSRIVSVTQKAAAGAKRIFDILDHVSNVPDPANPVPMKSLEGRIEMDGIGFRYGSRSVIRGLNLDIRPGEMIGLVGHSGSGKSTLVNDTLHKAAARAIHRAHDEPAPHEAIEGLEYFDKVINVDQSPIGRTPRSNPATYTGLFTPIRELMAETTTARERGYGPGRFSFNVAGGRCEACQGDGVVKVEMHFLPDVYVPCDVCNGQRYNRETLEVQWKGRNIAQILDLTVEDAHAFFKDVPAIARKLQTLLQVGLSYIRLGQSATTLSGGEAQRVKLAQELSRRDTGRTLYILDEPTTGLHFADIDLLLRVLHQLRDAGNTIVVIEHNLDVIKTADWLIDMGPEGGAGGGTVVGTGTPEALAANPASHTGRYLRRYLALPS